MISFILDKKNTVSNNFRTKSYEYKVYLHVCNIIVVTSIAELFKQELPGVFQELSGGELIVPR